MEQKFIKEKRGKEAPWEWSVGLVMTKVKIHCHCMVELDHHTRRFKCMEDWNSRNEMKFSSTVEKITQWRD